MSKKQLMPKNRAGRILVGLVAILALASLSGLALAGGGDVYIPELGIPVPAEKADAVRHSIPRAGAESSERAPVPTDQPDRIPAKLLGADVPVPISPTILRTTNGWLVSDGATLVAVYAGAAGDDPTQGRLVIVRQNLRAGIQTQDVVNTGNTGALTIDDAPLGAGVETAAQRGAIGLRGAHGAVRMLHLATDRVDTP